jgi:hypothetical protein
MSQTQRLKKDIETLDSCIEIVKTPMLKKALQKYRLSLCVDKMQNKGEKQ